MFSMNAGIQIRTIQPGDREDVRELHRRHYWRTHCLLLNADFYHWQFEAPPDTVAAGGDQSLVTVDGRGRVLSFLGVVLGRCTVKGKRLRGAHIISWLSHPEARGRGLGKHALRLLMEEYEFLFSRSPVAVSLAIFRQLGFRYVSQCSRWIGVLDPEATLSLAVDISDRAADRARARTILDLPVSEFT